MYDEIYLLLLLPCWEERFSWERGQTQWFTRCVASEGPDELVSKMTREKSARAPFSLNHGGPVCSR